MLDFPITAYTATIVDNCAAFQHASEGFPGCFQKKEEPKPENNVLTAAASLGPPPNNRPGSRESPSRGRGRPGPGGKKDDPNSSADDASPRRGRGRPESRNQGAQRRQRSGGGRPDSRTRGKEGNAKMRGRSPPHTRDPHTPDHERRRRKDE